MAKRAPKAPVKYYARIPERNPRGNPPHLAGNISIFGARFTAGGPWCGPFSAAQADTLRDHEVTDRAAMTFKVVDGVECAGEPGGPEAPEQPARKGRGKTAGAAAESEDEGPENPQAGEGAGFGATRRAKPSAEKKGAGNRKPARKSGRKRSGK